MRTIILLAKAVPQSGPLILFFQYTPSDPNLPLSNPQELCTPGHPIALDAHSWLRAANPFPSLTSQQGNAPINTCVNFDMLDKESRKTPWQKNINLKERLRRQHLNCYLLTAVKWC